MRSAIEAFLAGSPHAVVGASRNRRKFGNKVLRNYQQRSMPVYAVNPTVTGGAGIEGATTVADLAALPEPVHGISIITPPHVTRYIVDDAIAARIGHLWIQPGAEDDGAIRRASEAGLSVIHGGPCLLIELGFVGP